VPVLRAAHRPAQLVGFGGARDGAPADLCDRAVLLVSGIGNPEAFEASGGALGARITGHHRLADHHPYSAAEARALVAEAEREQAWLVTTAKDAAKLRPLGVQGRALEVELELLSGAPVLAALLDALPPARGLRERRALHEGLHG
jgi:tetraacyldisaccharide 4'-kinase